MTVESSCRLRVTTCAPRASVSAVSFSRLFSRACCVLKGGGWAGCGREAVEAREGVHGRPRGGQSHDQREDLGIVHIQYAHGACKQGSVLLIHTHTTVVALVMRSLVTPRVDSTTRRTSGSTGICNVPVDGSSGVRVLSPKETRDMYLIISTSLAECARA